MVYDTGYLNKSYRSNTHDETAINITSNLSSELTANGGDALKSSQLT